MTKEYEPILKALKLSLLTKDDIAALEQLQVEWKHWEAREQAIIPLKIAEQQNAAYAAFLDEPTAENERRLVLLADPILTGTRYPMLRRAFADLRERIRMKAAKIVRPVLERILIELQAEYGRRLEVAVAVMSNKKNDPRVIECRDAIDYFDKVSLSRIGESPMLMAERLIPAQIS